MTVVGDSRGGLIGSVAEPDGSGLSDAVVLIGGPAGTSEFRTDRAGMFAVPAIDGLALGQHATVTIAAGFDASRTEVTVDTRTLSRGLRELPPRSNRLDLSGSWRFTPGPFAGPPRDDAAETRVPGHIIFDGLVPEHGVGTFHRGVDIPAAWRDQRVFLRCDGAYGRAEVRVNGAV